MSTRAFKTRAGVNRVAFGANPRIEVVSGKPLKTSDPSLIKRLSAHPSLQTHTVAAAKKKAAKTPPATPPASSSEGGEQS